MDNLNVRFATLDDLAWCTSVEHIPTDRVRRTIDNAEALVAERDGQPWATRGWSICGP